MMHIFTISRIFYAPPCHPSAPVCRVIFLESRFSTDVTRLIAGRGEESTEGVNSNAKIAKNECFTFGFCIFLYVVEIVRC